MSPRGLLLPLGERDGDLLAERFSRVEAGRCVEFERCPVGQRGLRVEEVLGAPDLERVTDPLSMPNWRAAIARTYRKTSLVVRDGFSRNWR
jgi:hypothetical protein